jgi:hypothetical protein
MVPPRQLNNPELLVFIVRPRVKTRAGLWCLSPWSTKLRSQCWQMVPRGRGLPMRMGWFLSPRSLTRWIPERVMAFIVNKGVNYDERPTASVRKIPAICIAEEKDSEARVTNITDLFQTNRRLAALWSLLIEPGEGHGVGRSREMAMTFFEDVLDGAKSPWLANNQTGEIQPDKIGIQGANKLSWLPGEASARAWADIRGTGPNVAR